MKKITLLMLMIGFSSFMSAQCLTATYGQYPTSAAGFTPGCVGTAQSITTAGYAGEYSLVNVTNGVEYTFSSSITTDYITISDVDGTNAIVFGTGPIIWTADLDGQIRFYTHLDDSCGETDTERSRQVFCGTPLPPPTNDECDNAIVINCGDTLTAQTTEGATGGTSTSCVGTIGDDIWYKFSGNGQNVILTATVTNDEGAQVEVYESTDGTCAGFTPGTCFASAGTGDLVTTLNFVSVTGMEYYIHIGSWINGDPATNFDLSVTCQDIPSSAPDCASNLVPADGATNIATGDVLFTWDAPTTGTPVDSYDVYGGTTTPLTEADLIGNYTTNSATITVTGYDLLLYWKVVPKNLAGDAVGCMESSFTTQSPPPPPVNDDATGAILLTLDLGSACGANAITGISNEGTTDSNEIAPSCTDIYTPSAGNGDLWYKIVAPSSEFTLNATVETVLTTVSGSLYSGTPGNLTEVGGLCGNSWPKVYTGLNAGETYYYRAWDSYNDQIGTFTLCGYYLDCTNATVSYSTSPDCANSQFSVAVNVTSMGSATSLTVSDDQGNSMPVTATGIVTMGPYPFGASVVYTIANNQNAACSITSAAQTLAACPPVNDACSTATAITAFPYNDSLDASGASNNSGFITACSNGMNDGVWYTFVGDGGDITVAATSIGWDAQLGIYTGTCGTFTCVDTVDDGLEDDTETLTIAASEAGTTYYINFGQYSGFTDSPEGQMTIDVTSTAMGIGNNDLKNFTAYPNPVKDILNLSYTKNITNVEVFNLLGQQVIAKSVNASQSRIDMSNLSIGTYLVKVTSDDATKTIKVVKE